MSQVKSRRAMQRIRTEMFHFQKGRCCYCQRPMFLLNTPGDRQRLMAEYGLTRAQTHGLGCTLEHLRPRGDPLRNHPASLTAACLDCNGGRHATPWNVWATHRTAIFAGWPHH